jgi:transaldolase
MFEKSNSPSKINIDIFLDGADLDIAKKFSQYDFIKGFTSNPSLMHKSKITSYEKFIEEFLKITSKPISFEVVSDDLSEMKEQAIKLNSYGPNVYVKIPVVNSKGVETTQIISELSDLNIKLNVTAIFTIEQIQKIIDVVIPKENIILSIFAGRIADTGRDPTEIFLNSRKLLEKKSKNFKLLWASVREVYNIYQAAKVGSDIITATPDNIAKIKLMNKDLEQYSLETVKMFYDDAQKGNIKI